MAHWNEILQIIFIIIGATAAVFTAYATLKSAKLSHRSLQKPRFQKIVDIVIVPLLENVERQMNFLENRDYRWKYRVIWEIGKYKPITLDYETEHFHNEFKDKHLNIYHKIEKHDEKTDELEKELDFFAEKIRSFPDFKKEVSKMLEEYRDYVEGARKNHFESTNDNIECILRYIVNNEGELEQDNLYRDFWNRYRNKLLKFREREELEYIPKEKNDLEDAYTSAINILKDIEPQSPFIFEKWKRIPESDIRKIAILRICSPGTRVVNLRSLECSPEIDKLLNKTSEEEVLTILRKHKIRFHNQKTKWICHLFSLDILALIQDIGEFSGTSLEQERRARKRIMTTIRGMGLKTASDFLKDIGFSKYLAVVDSRVLGFLQNMGLASKQLKADKLSNRKIYYKLECIENVLAQKMSITVRVR